MVRNQPATIKVAQDIRTTYGVARVTVYRDRKGNYTVRPYGERLTPAEKRKGLTRARGRVADSIKTFYSNPDNLGHKLKFVKSGAGIERTRHLMPATINGRKGWFDVRNSKFLFKEQTSSKGVRNRWGESFTQYGTTQLNLRSVDRTAYGLMQYGSLEDFYLNWLNAKEKARLNEAFSDPTIIDWDEVYSHFETSDPHDVTPYSRPDVDAEQKGYDMVVHAIEKTVGNKWRAYLTSLGVSL